jgi:hypothetical protein
VQFTCNKLSSTYTKNILVSTKSPTNHAKLKKEGIIEKLTFVQTNSLVPLGLSTSMFSA